MVDPHRNRLTNSRWIGDRRTFVRTAVRAGATLAATGTGVRSATDRDVPPRECTEWSEPVHLGDGDVRAFTTVSPSGDPKYHGVSFDRDVLTGLPSASAVRRQAETDEPGDKYGPNGAAVEIHHAWSREFFVPLPETTATPFTFVGLNWNPDGHPPPGVYDRPHFDIHFHTLEPEPVDAIEGLRAANYTVPDRRLPEGYVRVPAPELDGEFAVVTDMGEHLVDPESPEFTGEEFTNTLIWGVYDANDDGYGELTFVEPMLTRDYLESVTGSDRYEISQPAAYPSADAYPTAYAVRDAPSRDAIVVTIESFTSGR